jgi:hypothetical protein
VTARGSRGQGACDVASGRPGLSPADGSPRVSNRTQRTPADLLADPLGSSHVVRTTDRAGVVLHVQLRFTVQTHVRQRLRRRQPCRAFGPVQDTHRDHTRPSRALTKKSPDSSHPLMAALSIGFATVYIPSHDPFDTGVRPATIPREPSPTPLRISVYHPECNRTVSGYVSSTHKVRRHHRARCLERRRPLGEDHQWRACPTPPGRCAKGAFTGRRPPISPKRSGPAGIASRYSR